MRKGRFVGECILLACGTFALYLGVLAVGQCAPFGDHSLAAMDGSIQYLDLFAYLKDVIAGANNARYSFSKVLGGNCLGIVAYYLASPVNLLVVLFNKEDLVAFFDLAVGIKLALAAVTFRVFLHCREGRRDTWGLVACLLSLSYALCQYSIAQASNIMWLDGVYMLPLVMLGVNRVVYEESSTALSVSVGLSILFNWYAGAINCLFSIMWLLVEAALCRKEHVRELGAQSVLRLGCVYARGMCAGVLVPGFLFVPAIVGMQAGSGAGMEWSLLKDLRLTSNPLSAIRGFSLGALSERGRVALWCGSLALSGCVLALFDRTVRVATRVVRAVTLCLFVLLYYVGTPDGIFSLLKTVSSYCYRYSYGSIAAIVALSADYYLGMANIEEVLPHVKRRLAIQVLPSLLLAVVMMAISWVKPLDPKQVGYALPSALLFAAIVLVAHTANHRGIFSSVALAVLVVVENSVGVYLLMQAYPGASASEYHDYSVGEQVQISQLASMDSEFYRVHETWTRGIEEEGARAQLRAYYNDPMAYSYASIMGYTSCPDDIQLSFLERLGYRRVARMMCGTNDALIAADSLLGVRYYRSRYEIPGSEEVPSLPEASGTRIYHNAYALPVASAYDPTDIAIPWQGNPFAYQNALWTELLGSETRLFESIEVVRTVNATNNGQELRFEGTLPSGHYALYGNIPWNAQVGVVLNVNDVYQQGYACWLSPSVFRIPVRNGDGAFAVSCELEGDSSVFDDGQFYALDLDTLQEASSTIASKAAHVEQWENGHVRVVTTGSKGESLFVSVPYDENWEVLRNGERIEPKAFAQALFSIPLVDGKNDIEMTYRVPGIAIGMACTAAGMVLIVMPIAIGARRTSRGVVHRE